MIINKNYYFYHYCFYILTLFLSCPSLSSISTIIFLWSTRQRIEIPLEKINSEVRGGLGDNKLKLSWSGVIITTSIDTHGVASHMSTWFIPPISSILRQFIWVSIHFWPSLFKRVFPMPSLQSWKKMAQSWNHFLAQLSPVPLICFFSFTFAIDLRKNNFRFRSIQHEQASMHLRWSCRGKPVAENISGLDDDRSNLSWSFENDNIVIFQMNWLGWFIYRWGRSRGKGGGARWQMRVPLAMWRNNCWFLDGFTRTWFILQGRWIWRAHLVISKCAGSM